MTDNTFSFQPQQFGKYLIEAELGRGGFGTVLRAIDMSLDRPVAIKILDPLLSRDLTWVQRFRREAKVMARLEHPHIVPIYETAEHEGRLFIAMKLVDGPTLAQYFQSNPPLSWDKALEILADVTSSLDYAHDNGVIHRDLKPGNILMGSDGIALTDFGFASIVSDHSMSISVSGGIVGTPAYISPEIWEGEAASRGTDIYALGCILYEMVIGRTLFQGKSTPAIMTAHLRPPDLPTQWPEDVPAGLSVVLNTALQKEPDKRYATAGEMMQALQQLSQDQLAEPYVALEAALAAQDWPQALSLAAQIKAQDANYRDLKALEDAAAAGQEMDQRASWAAQWREQAEASLQDADWDGARIAIKRWQEATPDDPSLAHFLERLQSESSLLVTEQKPPMAHVIPKPNDPEVSTCPDLEALYHDMRERMKAEEWDEAIGLGNEILLRDAGYSNTALLLQRAQKERSRSRQHAHLQELLDAGEWQKVQLIAEELLEQGPDYIAVAMKIQAEKALTKQKPSITTSDHASQTEPDTTAIEEEKNQPPSMPPVATEKKRSPDVGGIPIYRIGLAFVLIAIIFVAIALVSNGRTSETAEVEVPATSIATQTTETDNNRDDPLPTIATQEENEILSVPTGVPFPTITAAPTPVLLEIEPLYSIQANSFSDPDFDFLAVTCLVFAPDGDTFFTCGSGLNQWDTETGELIANFQEQFGHGDIAISPNGQFLAVAHASTHVNILNAANGALITNLSTPDTSEDASSFYFDVAFDPVGKTLAVKRGDGTLDFWSVNEWELLTTVATDRSMDIAFSPDNQSLSNGNMLWTASERSMALDSFDPRDVEFSADSQLLGVSAYETLIIDVVSLEIVTTLSGSDSLAFSPVGSLLATQSDTHLNLYQYDDSVWIPYSISLPPLGNSSSYISSTAFSPDGSRLAIGRWDGTVIVYRIIP